MTVTAVNARDVALKNTAIRVVGVSTNYISLTCPTLQFKYGSDNQPQPVAAVVTATLAGYLQGTVTFTYSGFSTAPTISGNQLSINPDNFTGDVVTINASLNYQGVNYQAVPITISKIFNQLVARTTRAVDLLPSYTDGTGYTLPAADNFVELYNGVSKITTGVVYTPATQTKNGVTVAVNASTGLITVNEATPNAWTSNTENFTLTATRNLIAYTTTYTITKAKQGTGGSQLAEIALYQWSTTQPATPTGTSTYTWLTKGHVYIGTDAWKETVPTSPGGVGIKLWQITVAILAQSSLSTTTYTVNSTSWAGGVTRQITTEANALIKTYSAIVYQNALSIPTISGSTTYTWLTNAITAAPTNWSLTPPAAQTGFTLYQAAVSLIAAQTDTSTAVNWSSASITPIRYYGTDGASARRAYALVTTTPSGTPTTYTATGDSLPAVGTWFTGITWTTNAPTSIAAGQTLYQSDGVFVTNSNTTWGFPYISSLKVGSLSAITTNTGDLTVSGSIKGGASPGTLTFSAGDGYYLNSDGKFRVGSATAARLVYDNGLTIYDTSGNNIFTTITTANTNSSSAVSTANAANSTASSALSTATSALQAAGTITWIVSSDIQIVTGSQLKKIGSTESSWSAQAYSAESYTGGAYVSFQSVRTDKHLMLGLNTDPAANASYDTIDHAWYILPAPTNLHYYENGSGADTGLAYTTDTVLSIVYDGRYVKYYRDGVVVRTVDKGIGSNLRYYVDSSFYGISGEVKSVRFGPVGTIGTRGSNTTYISGRTSWSDDVANQYFTDNFGGQKVVNDTVTQYGTNFSQTRVWTGAAWTQITVAIDGSLLVTGTVSASVMAAGSIFVGHQIKNAANTFVMDFGATPYISISV